MNYIYDIVLNLTDNFYYDFFEWYKNDNIINIKKVPILRVDNNTLKDFIDYKIKVNKNFLSFIENKSVMFKKQDNYKYLVIFSNKEKCIGIVFLENGTILYKSALLPDEEDEANCLVGKDITKINYKKLELNNCNLTLRSDLEKKKYLLKEIKKIYVNCEFDRLKYIYYDLFFCFDDNEKMYKKLIEYINESIFFDDIYETMKNNKISFLK